mgnify:CR=1 FL=1
MNYGGTPRERPQRAPGGRGLPRHGARVDRWPGGPGRRPGALGWYAVMSTFKLACVLEGVRVRRVRDPTREASPGLGDMVVDLVVRANRLIRDAADW